jgi:hypothetical protein
MADGSKPERRRGPGRPFAKGQSGNPGGMAAGTADLRALARTHTVAAIEALAAALADPRTRVAAAVALLDRGHGRPAQLLAGDGEDGPVQVVFRWGSPDA